MPQFVKVGEYLVDPARIVAIKDHRPHAGAGGAPELTVFLDGGHEIKLTRPDQVDPARKALNLEGA